MNLVFLLDSFGMGGCERGALLLLEALKDRADIKLSVVILSKHDSRISSNSYQVPSGIDTYYVYDDNYSANKKLLLTPFTVSKVKEIFVDKRVDKIISFHDYSNLINVLLKKTFNHRAITTELKYSKHYFGSRNRYMKYYLKFVFNKSDFVIVNDIEIKQSLIDDYGINVNIEVLNNLISINGFSESETSRCKKKNKITFITVGRLSEEKNTKDVLIAFAKIKQKNYNLKIIGDGPNRNELENLTKELEIQNHVEFVGQAKNVYYHLQKADIFVFSSLNEGFPNAVLEAMYAGLPIISYQFKAGITSILDGGKYGLLVNIHGVSALSQKMKELADDEGLRKKYSNLSKFRAKEYLNKTKYINDFLKYIS